MAESLKISVIDHKEGLQPLEADWNRLLQQSSSDTIFLTWEWITAWWNSYGAGKELWILKVEKDGKLVGLVPLYRKVLPKFGMFEYNCLYLIGDGSADSDYLDLIVLAGEEELVARSVVAFLLSHRYQWDILYLDEVPESSIILKCLRRFFKEECCYWEESHVTCTDLRLPLDWNEYLKCLKPRMRTKIRSLTQHLEDSHTVRFDCCAKPEDLQTQMTSLFQLHHRRQLMKDNEGVFLLPAKRQFYQEMAPLFLSRGWLRLYSLSLDGRYVAHQFCFQYRNRIFLLQEGFDPEWAEHGIGNVLRGYVLRDCIERKVAFYDFLGGVTQHKLSWGAQTKKSFRIYVGPPGSKNFVFFCVPRLSETVKAILRRLLPDSIRLRLETLRKMSSRLHTSRPNV